MIAQMDEAELPARPGLAEVVQGEIGGVGLWLRMEPDHDPVQAEALANHIAAELGT